MGGGNQNLHQRIENKEKNVELEGREVETKEFRSADEVESYQIEDLGKMMLNFYLF